MPAFNVRSSICLANCGFVEKVTLAGIPAASQRERASVHWRGRYNARSA
ncbi:hypothetical protein M5U04_02465 [Xenorhabdus sp. XENO-1]|nr:hypothetical protein [Xenorhabdus bovienii]MCP9266991.1 hypothetical protein [Xenorhabdus bovienii subsp. africana]